MERSRVPDVDPDAVYPLTSYREISVAAVLADQTASA